MKRFFGWWMAVCVVLAGCCGCGRQGLPVPEFPLEAGVVETALERAGLPWTIAAEESWAEGQTVYTLHDPEGRMVAIVSSTGEPQGRMLRLSFLPSENDPYGVSVSLPRQDWEKAVVLGTILYGGFAEEREVYTAFLATRNEKSAAVQQGEPPSGARKTYEAVTEWKSEIRGTGCAVRIGQPRADAPESDLLLILFCPADQ